MGFLLRLLAEIIGQYVIGGIFWLLGALLYSFTFPGFLLLG